MTETSVTAERAHLQALRSALTALAASAGEQLAHLAAIGLPEGIDELMPNSPQ